MAYNRRFFLLKVIEIQNIVLEEKKRGATQIWTYNNRIKDVYFISWATFNQYLARNAKRELSDMDKEKSG